MTVSFLDLQPTYREFQEEFDAAYRRVMESGRFLLGPELESFESEYARSIDVTHCVGVANGLEALQLALTAAGIGPGDEVIVQSNAYIATWFAVSHVGATIVPCEPDISTFNLDPSRLDSLLSERTKAVVPIHLYGQTANMAEIGSIVGRRGIFILEDAAQSHGAEFRGRPAGSLGHAAAFSFYPTKNLGALADAGAVTTDDPILADRVRLLRNYGCRTRYQNEAIGLNSRLGELQAAFLRVKLRHLDQDNARRAELAARYRERLAGIGDLILPAVPEWAKPVWHLFVVRTGQRQALRDHLDSRGVGTDIHYPVPPHLAGAYRSAGWKKGDFPIAERLADEVLSLPLNPRLSDTQLDWVCDSIEGFFAGYRG